MASSAVGASVQKLGGVISEARMQGSEPGPGEVKRALPGPLPLCFLPLRAPLLPVGRDTPRSLGRSCWVNSGKVADWPVGCTHPSLRSRRGAQDPTPQAESWHRDDLPGLTAQRMTFSSEATASPAPKARTESHLHPSLPPHSPSSVHHHLCPCVLPNTSPCPGRALLRLSWNLGTNYKQVGQDAGHGQQK